MYDMMPKIIATNWSYSDKTNSWSRLLFEETRLTIGEIFISKYPEQSISAGLTKYLTVCFICNELSVHPGFVNLDETKGFVDKHFKEKHPHVMLITDKTQCMM